MASATLLIENGSVQRSPRGGDVVDALVVMVSATFVADATCPNEAPVHCGGNVVGGDCGSGGGRGCIKSDIRGVGKQGATINNKKTGLEAWVVMLFPTTGEEDR
ncbi:hypothetical protein L6452_28184 [Arctium lappa]|uniref:Uncharacterized protein n=1 Tax=Arctium lappa TaxID=4217 RepID=A0ACB8ZYR5_ARCLA|nr:hypothetical protein L6452_28184 [Arctium lappa]